MPILRYFTCEAVAPWAGIWRPLGELDTCKHKFDRRVPDLQVFALLVRPGFDTVEEEKRAEGKPEETSSTLVAHVFIVCVPSSAGCSSTSGCLLQVFVFTETLQVLPRGRPPKKKTNHNTLYLWFVMESNLFVDFFQTSPPKIRFSASSQRG